MNLAPPKPHIFRPNFNQMFMFFLEPLPGPHFLIFFEILCQNPWFLDPSGTQLRPKWRPRSHFGRKNIEKSRSQVLPGTTPGVDGHARGRPKHSKPQFYRFFIDLGLHFWRILAWFVHSNLQIALFHRRQNLQIAEGQKICQEQRKSLQNSNANELWPQSSDRHFAIHWMKSAATNAEPLNRTLQCGGGGVRAARRIRIMIVGTLWRKKIEWRLYCKIKQNSNKSEPTSFFEEMGFVTRWDEATASNFSMRKQKREYAVSVTWLGGAKVLAATWVRSQTPHQPLLEGLDDDSCSNDGSDDRHGRIHHTSSN